MKKTTLESLQDFLNKARRRLSDEEADFADRDEVPDDEGLEERDADDMEGDAADKWLQENDTKRSDDDEEPREVGQEDDYDEYTPEDDEDAHQSTDAWENSTPVSDVKRTTKPSNEQAEVEAPQEASASAPAQVTPPEPKTRKLVTPQGVKEQAPAFADDDNYQPSKEQLARMREYTRPWEKRARDHSKLTAEAHINPVKHKEGRLLEARETAHADKNKAYAEHTSSPEYQNADPITQMEMDDKFHSDWNAKNPDHLMNALNTHHEAHKKGEEAKGLFHQNKDDMIRHIASGGGQADAMSMEEGMQHAGGGRDEEGETTGAVVHDPAAKFAAGNQDFLREYMADYNNKKKPTKVDMDNYDPGTRADPKSVLGDHPMLKDPARKREMDQFTAKYHPLIDKAAKQVISKLGLTDKANRGEIDHGILQLAGTHALFQAVNDYNPDHHSKASFKTHLNNKMQGLMQTALKAQQTEVPTDLANKAKKFNAKDSKQMSSPVTHTNAEGVKTVIGGAPAAPQIRPSHEIAAAHPPEVQDRLKRLTAAKPMVRKPGTGPKPTPAPKWNINHVDGGEEE